MPCLNEEETLGACISKAFHSINSHNLSAEVLIADNGSTDNSLKIAELLGARTISISEKGYGNVLRTGIEESNGKYIIIGDSDDSYDFGDILPFISKLREGNDLVMGNRFKGGIENNAMPFLHRYLGNPVLSYLGRLFFKIPIRDFHCGLRGVNKEAMLSIGLCSTGMEFASEMVVKSYLNNLVIAEVPTKLYPDGRSRPPHLNTWRDGWRHLRFLLLFSPKWLFLYPGVLISCLGSIATFLLFLGPVSINDVYFDINTMLYTAMLIIVGFQVLTFYFFSKIFAVRMGININTESVIKFNRYFSLEKGLCVGVLSLSVGIYLTWHALQVWNSTSFGSLNPTHSFRLVIPAVTLIVIGVQCIFNSFFFSILNLKVKSL
jgi:glycosyltransferase involved in cell wall biosynthesis